MNGVKRGRVLHGPAAEPGTPHVDKVTPATTRVRRLRVERAHGPPALAPALPAGEALAGSGLLEKLNSSRRLGRSRTVRNGWPSGEGTVAPSHWEMFCTIICHAWRVMNTQ